MTNLVLDSDALIKLTKSGLIKNIAKTSKLNISEEVFKEVVVEGKVRLYEDAFKIEEMVKRGILKKLKVKKIKDNLELGSGETSTLNLYKEKKFDLIVSDDRKFLNVLEQMGVEFTTPVGLIVALVKSKGLDKEKAINGIKNIKNLIREDAYNSAINEIGG
ncbi:MAG: hypothetical protein AABX61_03820 [Nanoarchaeota archaeon]